MRRFRHAARALAVSAVLAMALALPSAARAQAAAPAGDRARFEILSVGDSTFTFAVGARGWVKAHARGDAIDPRRRNALVARFEVLAVSGGVATALVTGETTRVTTADVALIGEPAEPFYRKSTFWGGVLAGVVAGAGLTAAFR